MVALAYVSAQRSPRDLGAFDDFEKKVAYRKYVLRRTYNGTETRCYDELRLTKRNFHNLCAMLREKGGLKDTTYVTVEENVAMFLQVVGHATKMRMIGYERSLETTSRHFGNVLTAILSLTREFIKLPEPTATPPDDYKWKWFPNALGALDGCHIDVFVRVADKGRYRNRKHDITTNMLGVVDWNMKFIYVLPGWEGLASDSKVLKDAMRIDRQDAFVVPEGTSLCSWLSFSHVYFVTNLCICHIGKYYLVDAGYTNGPGFLSPFRSTRYHLKEWAASILGPQTEKELYNLRHSRARNVVERCFGLLKKKWAILRSCSFFPIEEQVIHVDMDCRLFWAVEEQMLTMT